MTTKKTVISFILQVAGMVLIIACLYVCLISSPHRDSPIPVKDSAISLLLDIRLVLTFGIMGFFLITLGNMIEKEDRENKIDKRLDDLELILEDLKPGT